MILDNIISNRKRQVIIEKEKTPVQILIDRIHNTKVRSLYKALKGEGISIIAEIKKASPSKGIILEEFDHRNIARIYDSVEVDAISVLTERDFFHGSDEYLKDVRGITDKPILRKDFIVDDYQLYQSKAMEADAVLLIAGVLQDKLRSYYKLACELGLQCLVEVHDRVELELALEVEAEIIGINNRNLKNFEVTLKTTEELIRHVPKDRIVVSESGIRTAEDIKYLKKLGVDGVLIGETFMRSMKDSAGINKLVREFKCV